jgi:hypothetical protein
VHVIDVSHPGEPLELSAVATRSALGVDVVAGRAYVADGWEGLRIIDFGPEYVPEPDATLLGVLALATAIPLGLRERQGRRRRRAAAIEPRRAPVR